MKHGQVDLVFIRNDLAEYWQKWPLRHYRLISSPKIVRGNDGDYLVVRYRIAFQVENSTERISGEAEYMVGIVDLWEAPRVFSLEKKIMRSLMGIGPSLMPFALRSTSPNRKLSFGETEKLNS